MDTWNGSVSTANALLVPCALLLQLMRAVVEAGDDVQLSLLDSNTERESVIAQEYIDELVGAHANLHVHYFITRGAPGDGMSEGHITAEAIKRCGFEVRRLL